MIFTCKCLNITLDAKGSDTRIVKSLNLNLSLAEQSEQFFKEVSAKPASVSYKFFHRPLFMVNKMTGFHYLLKNFKNLHFMPKILWLS